MTLLIGTSNRNIAATENRKIRTTKQKISLFPLFTGQRRETRKDGHKKIIRCWPESACNDVQEESLLGKLQQLNSEKGARKSPILNNHKSRLGIWWGIAGMLKMNFRAAMEMERTF